MWARTKSRDTSQRRRMQELADRQRLLPRQRLLQRNRSCSRSIDGKQRGPVLCSGNWTRNRASAVFMADLRWNYAGNSREVRTEVRSGIMNRAALIRLLAVMAFAFVPVKAVGQSNLDPGRLPKSTAFYL